MIDKIRAEIDKLYDEYKDKFHQSGDQYHLGLIDGLDMAERVLDTIESEKPMNKEEFSKEFDDYYLPKNREQKGRWGFADIFFLARHFYELGKQHGIEEMLQDRPKDPRE